MVPFSVAPLHCLGPCGCQTLCPTPSLTSPNPLNILLLRGPGLAPGCGPHQGVQNPESEPCCLVPMVSELPGSSSVHRAPLPLSQRLTVSESPPHSRHAEFQASLRLILKHCGNMYPSGNIVPTWGPKSLYKFASLVEGSSV